MDLRPGGGNPVTRDVARDYLQATATLFATSPPRLEDPQGAAMRLQHARELLGDRRWSFRPDELKPLTQGLNNLFNGYPDYPQSTLPWAASTMLNDSSQGTTDLLWSLGEEVATLIPGPDMAAVLVEHLDRHLRSAQCQHYVKAVLAHADDIRTNATLQSRVAQLAVARDTTAREAAWEPACASVLQAQFLDVEDLARAWDKLSADVALRPVLMRLTRVRLYAFMDKPVASHQPALQQLQHVLLQHQDVEGVAGVLRAYFPVAYATSLAMPDGKASHLMLNKYLQAKRAALTIWQRGQAAPDAVVLTLEAWGRTLNPVWLTAGKDAPPQSEQEFMLGLDTHLDAYVASEPAEAQDQTLWLRNLVLVGRAPALGASLSRAASWSAPQWLAAAAATGAGADATLGERVRKMLRTDPVLSPGDRVQGLSYLGLDAKTCDAAWTDAYAQTLDAAGSGPLGDALMVTLSRCALRGGRAADSAAIVMKAAAHAGYTMQTPLGRALVEAQPVAGLLELVQRDAVPLQDIEPVLLQRASTADATARASVVQMLLPLIDRPTASLALPAGRLALAWATGNAELLAAAKERVNKRWGDGQ